MRYLHEYARPAPSILNATLFSLALFIVSSNFNPAQAQENSFTKAELHLQAIDIDLIFDGNQRLTEFNSLDIVLRQRLSDTLDGSILFGYLIALQNSNPIFAGQDLGGNYLGLDLRLHLANTQRFKMFGQIEYRYNWVDATITDQSVEWNWHQTALALHTLRNISNGLYISLGASTLQIDGVEKARGPVDQNIDFKAKDGLTGHIGLQFDLGDAGQIGMEAQTGSSQGGRITFQSSF